MGVEEIAVRRSWGAIPFSRGAATLEIPPDFIEILPIAIYACDAAGHLLWFNSRAAEIWGRKPQIGDDSEQYGGSHRLHADGRLLAREATSMAHVLRTGTPVLGAETQVKRPDGSIVWVTVHIEPITDENGVVLGAINCFHETTAVRDAADALTRHGEEQSALFELTDRLQSADAVHEIYELAIDAILRALNCQRAAILLFDDSQRMRFVAARGLSERYRRAVDGHSPWSADTRNAGPICYPDIDRADLPDALKETVRNEGIRALTFIPVKQDARLVGKFMAYYDAPHTFTPAELEVAVIIARQLAFGLEQKRAEEATERLVTIVESSDDAIISKNLDGIIMTWNKGAQRIFGYTAEEVVGKPVTILMPADRVDEEPGILARIRRGERIDHYETVRRCKGGRLIDVSLTISPMKDRSGRIFGASKIARNITDRKRAEAELRESERRLHDLLTAIPAAIYTTDTQGRITYYNEAAVEFAGRRPTLGSDRWCVTWKLYRPDGTPLPHDECPMALALKEGRAIRGTEAIAERPDGTRIPFIPFPTPLHDAEGNIVGAINMLVDISERRQAETQQRVLLRELNHRVKNNMQMLQSLLYTAMRQTQNAEARRVLEDATNRISAMASAQRVLYSTADATRFSASEFLEAVCRTAQQTFPPNVNIVCDAASGDLTNDTAMPLALILNELLTNAVKHGCTADSECVIHVGLTEDAGSFLLYVEDGGPGFDLQSVIKKSSGLHLVQLLARQLRGQFHATARPVSRCTLRFS